MIIDSNNNFIFYTFDQVNNSGWKIHISCTLKNSDEILNLVKSYLIVHEINFKYLKDIELYMYNSSKNGDRTSYGKYITIYPKSLNDFKVCIEDLYQKLKKFEGPYILSDRRYKDCKCLYYRYGSNIFNNKFDKKGNVLRTFYINDKEYIDEALPYFNLPTGLEDPLIDNYSTGTGKYFLKNYQIISAIKFSPIGGVYRCKDKRNKKIYIVKEYYQHTGIITENIDSIYIANKAKENLLKLKEFEFIVKYHEDFFDWENYYLATEYVEGLTFEQYIVKNNEIVVGSDEYKVKQYFSKLINIIEKIIKKIIILVDNNYFLGDISPSNIIIKDGDVFFIDIEILSKNANNVSDYNAYSLGFGKKEYSLLQNIKYAISNLILYGLNKKHTLFDKFTIEEILYPIIQRYPFLCSCVVNLYKIRSEKTSLIEIPYILKDIKSNNNVCLISCKLENNYKLNKYNVYIENEIINKNSLGYGSLGIYLANYYLNNIDYKAEDFIKYENDFRTNSFLYGCAGLLYIFDLFKFDSKKILNCVINNLDYEDFTLETGISGIGIALINNYKIYKNENIYKILDNICTKLIKQYIKYLTVNMDYSINKGLGGIALFLTYFSEFDKTNKYKKYSKRYIDLILKNIRQTNYVNLVFSKDEKNTTKYYIKNGIFGILNLLIIYGKINQTDKYDKYIYKLINQCSKIYSPSPSFYFGSAGFLYTYLHLYEYTKDKKIIENAKLYYNDTLITLKDNKFYHPNLKFNLDNFLEGDYGIFCVLKMFEDRRVFNIFPFI